MKQLWHTCLNRSQLFVKNDSIYDDKIKHDATLYVRGVIYKFGPHVTWSMELNMTYRIRSDVIWRAKLKVISWWYTERIDRTFVYINELCKWSWYCFLSIFVLESLVKLLIRRHGISRLPGLLYIIHFYLLTRTTYRQTSDKMRIKSPNLNVSPLVLQLPLPDPLKPGAREWRCSWSSADRRCSNYVWVIDNLIAY